ncbi:MAG: phosphoribosylanthranilate isomerase [Armatimonadota bacterium]|nr:phosphoribosylanthranilate isomerase [Armatimonadota bacterium]
MTRIKICGISDEAAAAAAAEAGADAIGLIFAASRRQVDASRARRIAAALPPFVTKVGVVVNEPLDRLRALVEAVRLDAVQLHGDEGPAYCQAVRDAGVTVIKAIRVAGPLDAARLRALPVAAVLLDTHRPGVRGGTGEPFDWRWAVPVASAMPVILSGGLSPENVAAGIAAVRPYGVDVSSGVETDGRKDPGKIRAFVAAVRAADARLAAGGPKPPTPPVQDAPPGEDCR